MTGSLIRLFVAAMALLGGYAAHAQAPQSPADYRVHAGDQLEVSVWKEVELQRTIIVRPDGKFSFPLTGEIAAAGRTIPEIRADVEKKLKVYIPEPVVTLSVTGIEGNKVYVIGQVVKPGAFTMNPRISVLQALSIAGGTTPFAALNEIIVVRTTNSGQKVIPFRYTEVNKGRNLEQNVLLESGDVVIVP
jgi:polysaccharide export outer membrane protein